MEFIHNNKSYDVLKIDGKWRVYTSDMHVSEEEAKEVLAKLEKMDKEKTEAKGIR